MRNRQKIRKSYFRRWATIWNSQRSGKRAFRDLCFDITDAGICLASAWLFQDFDDNGMNGARLAVLGEANDELKAKGKARLDKYWPKVREKAEKHVNKEKKSRSGLKTAALIAAAATAAAVAAGVRFLKNNSHKK